MSEPDFKTFTAWVRQRGLPLDEIDLDRLYDGYLKLQRMTETMRRSSDLNTGLAVDFHPEPVQ